MQEIEDAVPFDLGFPHNFIWGEKVPQTSTNVWLLGMGGKFVLFPRPRYV